MALSAGNVRVGVTGSIAIAPENTVDPGDATSALIAPWVSVGYLSEDGVVEANSIESDDIKAWQNAEIVRKVITSKETTYGFTMIETNADALALFYGKTIIATDVSHVIGGDSTARYAVCLTIVDGTEVIRRWIPSAEVTEQGEVTFGSTDAAGYEVTMTAYPVSDVDGLGATGVAVAYYSTALVSGGVPIDPPGGA